ncbi:MAG: hypothetical protein ABF621_25270 [Paenibacillus polymyxa]
MIKEEKMRIFYYTNNYLKHIKYALSVFSFCVGSNAAAASDPDHMSCYQIMYPPSPPALGHHGLGVFFFISTRLGKLLIQLDTGRPDSVGITNGDSSGRNVKVENLDLPSLKQMIFFNPKTTYFNRNYKFLKKYSRIVIGVNFMIGKETKIDLSKKTICFSNGDYVFHENNTMNWVVPIGLPDRIAIPIKYEHYLFGYAVFDTGASAFPVSFTSDFLKKIPISITDNRKVYSIELSDARGRFEINYISDPYEITIGEDIFRNDRIYINKDRTPKDITSKYIGIIGTSNFEGRTIVIKLSGKYRFGFSK